MSNATRYQEDFGPIPESISIPQFNEMDIIGQWNKSFILTRLGGSIIAIDQHAACEAQNFEKLRKAKNGKKQKLIQPILVTVSPDDLENAATYKERMSQLGFDYRIEDDKILVESIPTNETVSTGICDFQELLSRINDVPESTPMTTNARKQLAYHACHSSVVVGDTMSKTQMRKLLDRMGSSDAPWNCPHGRPTWCCLFNLNDGKPEPFYEG